MRNKLLYLLPIIVGLNGISFHIFNLNIRFDQLLAVILSFILILRIMRGAQKLYIDLPGKFLIMFFAISFFSSYFYSPDKNYSIIETINILSAASIYFLIPNFINSNKNEKKFLKVFVLSGIFMCGLGVLLFILAHLGITDYGVNLTVNPPAIAYGVYSTMYEPNIFGSYSVIYFIYSLNIILIKDFSTASKRIFLFLLFFSATGVFLSFTRGVWLAAIVASIISIVLLKRRYPLKLILSNFIKYLLGVGLIIAISLGYMISDTFLLYKIDNFLNASSGTGYGRLQIWSIALEDISKRLILGSGTYSFAAIYSPSSHNAWIGNFLITVIHDTGIIGAFLFLSFLSILIFHGLKKTTFKSYNFNANIFSLSMALIAMLIAFFFTSGFGLGYAWLPLGLLSYFYKKQKLARN